MTAGIGKRVERYRKAANGGKGITVQALADRCKDLGLPLDRSVLAKLEKGLRQGVSVAELILLAKALGVPPLLLIFPVGDDVFFETLPGNEINTWDAAKWFTGEDPFPVRDPADSKWIVTTATFDDWETGAGPAVDYRWHDEYLKNWRQSANGAAAARKAAGVAQTDAERDAHLRHANSQERQHRVDEDLLREHRKNMRRRGVTPPEFSGVLAHIDQPE